MKKFGIEIRKADDISNIYNDVDQVLSKFNIHQNESSDIVKIQTIAHSLQKMLNVEGYFSVCVIDSCMSVGQISISKDRYDIYRAAHCLHWSDMLPDYRQMLVAMVLDDFRPVLSPEGYDIKTQ